MISNVVKRVVMALSLPIRHAIRHEVGKLLESRSQDIRIVLQRKATESTADYVEKYMGGIDSVSSNLDLLTKAFRKADVSSNKLICEFGVFSGNTINHIASLTDHKVYGFDSFEGLPERWRDGLGKGFFRVDRLPSVRPNVELMKGWFSETIPSFMSRHDEDICFLHVDCDLYSSTKTIFDLLGDRIAPGCVIVFDEYFNYPGWKEGEFLAFHEFVNVSGLAYEYIGYNRLHEQVAVVIKASEKGGTRE